MKLFGRRRSSGPRLEERLAAFRAERGGGHDLPLLERRTAEALAESGLEWEGEQLADERKWEIASESGPVWIFSSVRDDAISLEQTLRSKVSLDDDFPRTLLEYNSATEGVYASLGRDSEHDPHYLSLEANVPLEGLDADSLRSAYEALLRRREFFDGDAAATPGPHSEHEAVAKAAAAVEELDATLELGLEPDVDPYSWLVRTDLPEVRLQLDSEQDVLRATIPIEAAEGVRGEAEFFAYFLRLAAYFNSGFYAIVPHRRGTWVAAMGTVPMAAVTPELVAFGLEHPMHSAHYWRDV